MRLTFKKFRKLEEKYQNQQNLFNFLLIFQSANEFLDSLITWNV